VPVDVQALGCVAYAAAGQKWLCGADGTGMLYLQPEFGERVRTISPGYMAFEDASKGLESSLRAEARRFDGALPREAIGCSAAALEVLEAEGLDAIFTRAHELADRFADALREAGRTVAPRGRSTLVAFEDDAPEETRARLAEHGVAVRNLPGYPYLRASVGAWNDESDLERLLNAL
jgi:selenocysteine lyase/cysteine desulfurase